MNVLMTFADGDIDYVSKLNSNFATIQTAISGLETKTQAAITATQSPSDVYFALFGSLPAFIGSESYALTESEPLVYISDGYCWVPAFQLVVHSSNANELSLSGRVAGIYYVVIDSAGTTRIDTTTENAIYSIEWNGSSIINVIRLANIVGGFEDSSTSRTSSVLNTTYTTIDARLEAGESISKTTQTEVVNARSSATYGNFGSLDARLEKIETEVSETKPYDIIAYYPELLLDNIIILSIPIVRDIAFLLNFAGSIGTSVVPATESTVFSIKKGNTEVGTITFAAGSSTATFVGSAVTFTTGDKLTVSGPAIADASLAGVGIVLVSSIQ